MTLAWEELPRKFTPKLERRVSQDWHQYFPELGLEKSLMFGRRVGSLYIGLNLGKNLDGEYYDPEFYVHNLNRDMNFIGVFLGNFLRTVRTNAIDSIKLRWHDRYYRDAVERMRQQALLPLGEPISLDQVIQAYQEYVAQRRWPEKIQQLEDPAMIAAWAGESQRAQSALEWGYQTMLQQWNKPKEQVDDWRIKMEAMIADPEQLRQINREEVIKHKLTKIPYQDFTNTVYKEIVNV